MMRENKLYYNRRGERTSYIIMDEEREEAIIMDEEREHANIYNG